MSSIKKIIWNAFNTNANIIFSPPNNCQTSLISNEDPAQPTRSSAESWASVTVTTRARAESYMNRFWMTALPELALALSRDDFAQLNEEEK